MLTTYLLNKKNGCFEDFNVLLIALSSLAIATELKVSGQVNFKPGDIIAISGRHFSNQEVRLPLFGPVEAALAGVQPDVIEIAVAALNTAPPAYACKTSGFVGAVEAIFQPFFVNYYERYLDEIRSKFGDSDLTWPAAWQMGWVVRNAISHNGCIYFRSDKHPTVTWENLSFSHADNDKRLIHAFFSVADLILLLIEMEESRSGVKLPKK